MPSVRPTPERKQLDAILTADCHFGHTVPGARGEGREDWYGVQEAYIQQVEEVADGRPIFVAGDLLHIHNEPAEFINFLARTMRGDWIAVPGNHDLPNHSLVQLARSAYWSLVEMNAIRDISIGNMNLSTERALWYTGFPHGAEPRRCPPPLTKSQLRKLAVVHRYVWIPGTEHKNAKADDRAAVVREQYPGFDVILTGDNHTPFEVFFPEGGIFNAGCLIRRRANERDIKPSVGLLYSDGTVERYYLDTSADKWRDGLDDEVTDLKAAGLDPDAFLEAVRTLGDVTVSYWDAVQAWLRQHRDIHVPDPVRDRIAEISRSVKEGSKR